MFSPIFVLVREQKKPPEKEVLDYLLISAAGWRYAWLCVVAPIALRPYLSIGVPFLLGIST
jgi:hypothetical protein